MRKEKWIKALARDIFSATFGSRKAESRPDKYRADLREQEAEAPDCLRCCAGGLSREKERVPQGGASQRIALEDLHLIRSRTLERAHSSVRSRLMNGGRSEAEGL